MNSAFKTVLGLFALAIAGAGAAGPTEVTKSATTAASGVAVKVEKAVKRGAKATGAAIERGGKAAGAAVNKAAKKVGLPAGSAAPSSTVNP